jgi:hypothetical protein
MLNIQLVLCVDNVFLQTMPREKEKERRSNAETTFALTKQKEKGDKMNDS